MDLFPALQTKLIKQVSGFTLIELMVVVSLIAIMFSIGLASYNTFNRNQILQQAAEETRSNLRLAQNYALVGQKPAGCAGLTLKGYNFVTTVHTYSINAVCSDDSISGPIKTVDLSSKNISISVNPNPPATIVFLVLARGVDTGNVQDKTITLSTPSGLNRVIEISTEGVIKLRTQ